MCKSICILTRTNLQKILDVLLHIFCFILIVDPPNVIFKAKNVAFIVILFILMMLYRKIRYYKIALFLSVYLLLLATFMRGVVADYEFDYEYTIMYFKTFSPLLLLCWIDKLNLLNKLTFPCVCISLISLFIACTMFWLPELEAIVYNFMLEHDNFILMSNRSFLGYNFINVYYRSIPLAIIPCSIYWYKTLFEYGHKRRNFLLFAIFALALFFSGTRANMLSVVFIGVVFFIIKIRKGVFGKILSYFSFLCFCLIFLFMVWLFLSEKGENSNMIKFGHLASYIDWFSDNPDILLMGQGIGGLFYSSGFNSIVPQTEWSYIEIIRYVGILGGIYIIGIFIYPLWLLYRNRKYLKYAGVFSMGYIFYLIIAGTNPLLTNSTGMLTLLMAYSYALSPAYRVDRKTFPIHN